MTTSISVAQARNYEQDPSQIPAGTSFDIIDTAANIDTLTSTDISNFSSLLGVTTMVSTDGPVIFTPGGAEQAALDSAGITIEAHVSVPQAIQLDVQYNMSGGPELVPSAENLIVVDTAANLETLTPRQISDLGKAVDTATATGKDSGTSAVTEIAATDAPPVFTTNQIDALSRAGIAIVAPPGDPNQNDGTTAITGRGMTFDITWDSSVASAPAAFKIDVEQAFQFFADTYSSPVTLHLHVGFGERNGSAIGSGFLGQSFYYNAPQESYSDLVSQLTVEATSAAQLQAVSTLPATDPTSATNGTYYLSQAQAETLGFANAGSSSDANPDGYIGFSSNTSWNYSADPNQTPVAGEWDFLGSVEHELTEILGRSSFIGDPSSETFTDQYSLMDLYRFSADATRALKPHKDPSYFSIDNGATDLTDFNNCRTGDNGDLGDWSGTTVNGTLVHTPESFNDESDDGVINPFTAADATLMNVLGYDFASAPTSPIALPATDITLSAGQLLEYLALDKINPGSMNAPSGNSYVVIDTPFAIESLTADEMTQALSIGVRQFIVDGGVAFLQGSDPSNDQVDALGTTPFLAVLTVAQALALEANPPATVPANETVMIVDTAANIETLSASDISALPSIGVSSITATDAPVTFTPGGPEQAALTSGRILITAQISVPTALSLEAPPSSSTPTLLVPPSEHIMVVDTAANLEALDISQLAGLPSIADLAGPLGHDTGTSAVTQIAASDTLPVFSADQMKQLGKNHIAVVAPPNDPTQNDGTVTITGRGMTFVITFDPSVASAPREFKADVEAAFQFYADTYSSPVTLYYHVGFGERNDVALKSGALGESSFAQKTTESYSTVLSTLNADAKSPAQLMAVAGLPAADPTNNPDLTFTRAEAEVLGFANAPASSSADPDGAIGFSDTVKWNYSADPNQTPVAGEWDFLATVEHELTEVLGRFSPMNRFDSSNTREYSLIDLYRYRGLGTRALGPNADPSYFSIDGGATDLGDWNNLTTGNTGDLADWAGTTVNGVVEHTPDSFNDDSNAGIINPYTASDATLMNVLGYDLTSAAISPIPLASSDMTLSVGQLLEDLTLNEINPGSVNALPGHSYVVIDTAFDIESLTAAEITQALSIGVGEFIVDGAIAFLQGSDPHNDQITALGNTPFIAALTAAEAVNYESNPPPLPPNEIVIVSDTAANIEALSSAQLAGLGSIGMSQIDVSDLSGTGPLLVQDAYTYAVHAAVTADETVDFTGAGGTLELDGTPDMKGTISGFASGDRIVLSDIADDPNGSAHLDANNVLEVTENGVTHALQLDPAQDFAGDYFHLFADPTAGTDIIEDTTPCYCPGTLILIERGEIPVENLAIGDRVMTRSGVLRPIKWIGRRGYAGRFVLGRRDILPVCIKAGALADNLPRRDLWISPHHAMYFRNDSLAADADGPDGVLIEAKDLVNGTTIVQAERVETIEYFHIELDTHDVIIAEGAMSESFLDDDSRGMFHNAHEFHALYPGAAPSVGRYCAPRLDSGYQVEAVRQAIAERAGRSVSIASSGAVRGSIDAIKEDAIEGWAQSDEEPEAAVCLDVFIGGRRAGQTLANRFREDLAEAGIGSGHHAFRFELPLGVAIGNAAIDVRRSLDGERLG